MSRLSRSIKELKQKLIKLADEEHRVITREKPFKAYLTFSDKYLDKRCDFDDVISIKFNDVVLSITTEIGRVYYFKFYELRDMTFNFRN